VRKFFTKRFNRKTGMVMQSIFTMVVIWACTGLWHGASWSFVLWGLYWCLFMILEQFFFQKHLDKLPGVFGHVYLMLILVFSRVIFRFGNVRYSLAVLRGLFGLNGNRFLDFSTATLLKNNLFILIFCAIAVTPLIRRFCQWLWKKAAGHGIPETFMEICTYAVVPVFLLVLSTAALVGSSYNPFLYYRF
jgi:alginate O-acetyltransferase complex protein AlgI